MPLPAGTQTGGHSGNPSLLLATSYTVQSLSAVSAGDVWGVGQAVTPDNGGVALAEHWNGQSWSVVPVRHAGNSNSAYNRSEDLTSVDAISAGNTWAVGFYPRTAAVDNTPSSMNDSTLIEHWNGTAWSIVAAPDASPSDNLNSVSADSSTDIWAVGGATYTLSGLSPSVAFVPLSYDAPLVEHWNGSSWRIVPAPTLGLDPHNPAAVAKAKSELISGAAVNFAGADLTSVRAISPTDVWASGVVSFANQGGDAGFRADETLTEHWNGTKWSIVAAPDVTVAEIKSAAGDDLDAISGSAGDLWTVGRAQPIGTLVLHWNGTAWSVVPSPQTGGFGYLNAVLDLGSSNVWAAGDEIDHWNGTAWTQMPTLNGAPFTAITAIAATAPDDIWFADVTDFVHYACPATT
jgi:hypothetical protein